MRKPGLTLLKIKPHQMQNSKYEKKKLWRRVEGEKDLLYVELFKWQTQHMESNISMKRHIAKYLHNTHTHNRKSIARRYVKWLMWCSTHINVCSTHVISLQSNDDISNSQNTKLFGPITRDHINSARSQRNKKKIMYIGNCLVYNRRVCGSKNKIISYSVCRVCCISARAASVCIK